MSRAEERRRLKCPQACRDSAGRIRCMAVKDELCAHQRFCGMIGLWVENEFASECAARQTKQARETATEIASENSSTGKKTARKQTKAAKAEGRNE